MASGARAGRKPARLLVMVLGVAALAALAAVLLGPRISSAQAPPEELSNAELLTRVARTAEDPPQFGATVTVEQDLIPTQLLDSMAGGAEGGAALASAPQTARVWYGGEDRARAELLGENGDKVFVKNGEKVSFYDGATNTLRTGRADGEPRPEETGEAVSPAEVQKMLARLGEASDLEQAEPTTFEGRGAHVLTLTPKQPGSTLVGRAQALLDSETYLPVRFLLFADGTEEPVLSYEVYGLDVGPVPTERFELQIPPGAEVLPLEPDQWRPDPPTPNEGRGREDGSADGAREVAGVAEAREAVDFGVRQLGEAPGGRALEGTYLTPGSGVVLAYGSGWGTVVLSQEPGEGAAAPPAVPGATMPEGGETGDALQLPTVDLGGGVEAREFSTPVGTALMWSDNGVSYTLAGSVPAAELERAARGLR